MSLKAIIKLFDSGNVCVTGLRGRGKDMLFGNVICRRKQKYISNVIYDDSQLHIDFKPTDFDIRNSYDNFITGKIIPYNYPYPDGIDVYISDVGIYFPSQYCNELNKKYASFISWLALSRQLGDCNVHINVQNLNRAWDKLREQSDIYIYCRWCKVFGKLVMQKITLYESYESCVKRVKPYSIPFPVLGSKDNQMRWKLDREHYEQTYGVVRDKILIYINKSSYDTRIFKSILEGNNE